MSGSTRDVVAVAVIAGGPYVPDTHYMRAGRGTPVVLLTAASETAELLIAAFPRSFRVMAPILASADDARTPDFPSWLRHFLDALGLPRASIIVDPPLAADALGYTLQEPDRIDRIVFLLSPTGAKPDVEQGVTDRLVEAGQALLATPFDARDAAGRERTLAEITAFLETAEAPAEH